LPLPEKDEPGGFSALFFADRNQTTVVDRTFAEMWEQHAAGYMKGLEHVNPGGWTYTRGWSQLINDQTIINEADTMLREKAQMEQRLRKLEAAGGDKKTSSLDNRSPDVALAGLGAEQPLLAGGALALLGGGLLFGGVASRRRMARDATREGEPQSGGDPAP
jgi:hydroxylamine dehydrogenase